MVAGREDFLRHDKVRGLTCFFQFLSEPDDLTALAVCLKLLFSCPEDLSESLQRFLSSYQGYSLPKKLELLENEYRNVGVLTVSLPLFRSIYPLLEKKKPAKLLETAALELSLEQEPAVQKLLNTASFYSKTSELLAQLILGQESDLTRSCKKNRFSSAVTLTTLHGSKGLEFPVVFLCGVNQGNLPLEAQGRMQSIEEERRLFYVGMTRAKDELILLSSDHPSSFLEEIPQELLKREARPAGKAPHPAQQLSLF